MFARTLSLELEKGGMSRPVPQAWLAAFFMRDFTGHRVFDDTLVAGDGRLEAGWKVDPAEIEARFLEWLRGRKMICRETVLRVRPA